MPAGVDRFFPVCEAAWWTMHGFYVRKGLFVLLLGQDSPGNHKQHSEYSFNPNNPTQPHSPHIRPSTLSQSFRI